MGNQRSRREGDLTHSVQTYRTRHFPISCANRAMGAWSAYGASDPKFGKLRITVDEVTPNYWARRNRGEFIETNSFYTVSREIVCSGSSSFSHVYNSPPYCTGPDLFHRWEYEGAFMPSHATAYGGVDFGRIIDGDRVAALLWQTRTEAMAGRQKGSANYVESLAELDKTFAMVVHPLENVVKFCKNFRKTHTYRTLMVYLDRNVLGYNVRYPKKRIPQKGDVKFKEIRDLNRLWTSEWLRFRYGITPLMSDVREAIKALSKSFGGTPKRYSSRASNRIEGFQDLPFELDTTDFKFTWHKITTETQKVKAWWFDEYTKNEFTELGLTLHNVIAVPWELTKMSFVIDWFGNVGDLIYANAPRVNVKPLGGGWSIDVSQVSQWGNYHTLSKNPAVIQRVGDITDQVQATNHEHTRNRMDERTKLVVKDDFRLTTWTRALDAIALVAQQLDQMRLK